MPKWRIYGQFVLWIRQKHTFGANRELRNIQGVQTTVLTAQKYVHGGREVPIIQHTTMMGILKRWAIRYMLSLVRKDNATFYDFLIRRAKEDPFTVDALFGAGQYVGLEGRKELLEQIRSAIETAVYPRVYGCAFITSFDRLVQCSDAVGLWKEFVESGCPIAKANYEKFVEVAKTVGLPLELPSYPAGPIELMTRTKRPEHTEVAGVKTKYDYPEEVRKLAAELFGKDEEVPRQIVFYQEAVNPLPYVFLYRTKVHLDKPLAAGLVLLMPLSLRFADYLSASHITNFSFAGVVTVTEINENGEIRQGRMILHIDSAAPLSREDLTVDGLLKTSARVKKLELDDVTRPLLENVQRWLKENAAKDLEDAYKKLSELIRKAASSK